MDSEKAPESFGERAARIAYALNGIEVQKPDGSTALVGEQLPSTNAVNSWHGLKWAVPLKFKAAELPLACGEQLGVDARPRNADGSLYGGQTFMYGEQGDEPLPPTWEQITAALSRLGMVPVARSWYHEARVLMDARQIAKPGGGDDFPSNALRPLHGEKWR